MFFFTRVLSFQIVCSILILLAQGVFNSGNAVAAEPVVVDIDMYITPGLRDLRQSFDPSVYTPALQGNKIYVSPDGNDNNAGTIAAPLRTVQRAWDKANSGDMIYLRGGVYKQVGYTLPARNQQFTLGLTKSGSTDAPIVVTNYPGETPVFDGSEPLMWKKCSDVPSCASLPNAPQLYVASLPISLDMNAVQIYENGKVMPLTRSIPALDPYYFDIVSNGTAVPNGTEYTLTTLVMPSVFTSTDSQFYKGAQIWINSCNNNLKQLDITAYDPATAKITFASIGCDGYLTPNKDKFVIANLATTLRQGEIYIDRANQHVVAWPTNAANIANNNVTLSRITGGVFVGNASNVHISGIKFTRFSGDAVAKYAGSTGGDNIVIYKNVFSQNRGIGINLNAIKNVRIAKNDIHENSGGIALAKAERSIVSHNRVTSAILSGIRIYTGKDSWVHNNVVYRSGGHHGNAYTLGYLGNDGMLAEANFAKESNISLTLQQSQNMVYYQNTFYSPTEMWPMAAWGGKMTDGSNPRNVTIIGNTIVRESSTKPVITVSPDFQNVSIVGNRLSNEDTSITRSPTIPNPLNATITKVSSAGLSQSTSPDIVTVSRPPTVTLVATKTSLSVGETNVLTWTSTDATTCSATDSWSGSKATSGSETVSAVRMAGTRSYVLTCTGLGGSVSQKVTVITVDTVVDEERDMTPTLDLRITPVTTPAGSTAVLTWESKNVDTCTAGGSWSGSKPRMGTETTARLIETGNHQFSVTCTTDTGATVTKQVSVLVTGQIPPPEKTDIRVVMNDNVNVRATPGGAKVGMQVKGAMGTQSPAPAVVSGGYSWAYINFDAGSDGYVATAYITPVATTELTEDQKKSEIRKLLRELERLQVMLLALLAQQE